MPLIRKFARGIPTWAKWMANFWEFVIRWTKKIWGYMKDPGSLFKDIIVGIGKMISNIIKMNILKTKTIDNNYLYKKL